ncbi:phage terminase large subunit [Sphingomonas sp. R1]|uniref:phage terminase large subunit n=1 Tax=Sphingomonas sp. R1 TaxID=399176 RepID=UPI002223EFF9|nr:phage terminase large subunit [Sphingomonas sp. R1]UYY77505.1 phage terminase large subunit [Sphingomonas sp. R1]
MQSTKPLQGIRHDISKRNPDQVRAHKIVTSPDYKFFLAYGGSGGGKSFYWMDVIIERANRAPNSRHAIFRLTRNSCEKTLFDKTLHEVLDKAWPGLKNQLQISQSTMTVTFANGSKLFFDGLDENRMTKVLGDEFNTIWINECNEDGLSYQQVSTLLSRLRARNETDDGKILKNKMFFDCNPRFYSDWEYKAFITKVNPEDGDALHNADQWIAFKMEAEANKANLHEDYIESLMAGSAASRRRYVTGEWSDENQNALFTEAMFRDNRIPKPATVAEPSEVLAMLRELDINLQRVTIACDPAVTADPKSDLTGITVQGITSDGHVYVLDDLSDRYTPDAACKAIEEAFRAWGASRIIMEKNQGGLWLDATLRKHFPAAPLKFVSANATTGGKASRAEPVSAQYERGVVHHVGTLKELEQQMCDFGSPASRRKSPDRMDAVVWGITELLDLAHEQKRTAGYTPIRTARLR